MTTEEKLSQKDSALVNILERLADQIKRQDIMIGDMQQSQLNFLAALESAEFRQCVRQDETDAAIKKLNDEFRRYRSDMLGLADDQGRMDKSMKEFSERQRTLAAAQEVIVRNLADLDSRFKTQEKTAHEHLERSVKQAEEFSREFSGVSDHVTRLHMETEKRLAEAHRETQRRLEELRLETERRLLALDDVESAFKLLLQRTEPPEKKPLWIVRLFRRTIAHVRSGLSGGLRRLLSLFRTGDDNV